MADNLKGIPFSTEDEGVSYPDIAKQIVRDRASEGAGVYVVWFAYVLGAWKAICSTDVPDGKIYEVTFHNGRQVAFVDTYVKVDNQEVTL